MSLPANVHVSRHPCLLAKLSQLRSKDTSAKEVKSLVHEVSVIVACEALASSVSAMDGPKDETPIGFEYTTTKISPQTICLVPILRSGLAMVEGPNTHTQPPPFSPSFSPAFNIQATSPLPITAATSEPLTVYSPRLITTTAAVQTLLPDPVPVHHLGLYREPLTLQPVEYYNNLPNHTHTQQHDPTNPNAPRAARLAFILDPVIATGGTCAAAIQTLREWGVERIVVLSVIAAAPGVKRAAEEWPEGAQIWVGGVDDQLTDRGMLCPGLGDVGDRLFLAIGK